MSDSIDIYRDHCRYPGCKELGFLSMDRCLRHLVRGMLNEFGIAPSVHGISGKGVQIARQIHLRERYIAFFEARAKGIAAGTTIPSRSALDSIAVALSVHPHSGKIEGKKFKVEDWTRLMLFVEAFDRRIAGAIRRKERHDSRSVAGDALLHADRVR